MTLYRCFIVLIEKEKKMTKFDYFICAIIILPIAIAMLYLGKLETEMPDFGLSKGTWAMFFFTLVAPVADIVLWFLAM